MPNALHETLTDLTKQALSMGSDYDAVADCAGLLEAQYQALTARGLHAEAAIILACRDQMLGRSMSLGKA